MNEEQKIKLLESYISKHKKITDSMIEILTQENTQLKRMLNIKEKLDKNDDLYTHVDNYCYFCEETNEILSQNIYVEFSRLNDKIEIIEEPKEELEEI